MALVFGFRSARGHHVFRQANVYVFKCYAVANWNAVKIIELRFSNTDERAVDGALNDAMLVCIDVDWTDKKNGCNFTMEIMFVNRGEAFYSNSNFQTLAVGVSWDSMGVISLTKQLNKEADTKRINYA
eukprot:IDg12607t1